MGDGGAHCMVGGTWIYYYLGVDVVLSLFIVIEGREFYTEGTYLIDVCVFKGAFVYAC